jgi:hypothetical protein
MPIRDLFNNINPKFGVLATTTSDNTAQVSAVVDTLGYESVTYVIAAGILADADATFAVTVDEGNQANLSDASAVASTDLLGTTALASFTFANDNQCFKIGYVGNKRYVRVTVTPTNNTGSAPIAGVWIMGQPALKPTANPPN